MSRGFLASLNLFNVIQCLRHHNRQRLLKRREKHRVEYAEWLKSNDANQSPLESIDVAATWVTVLIDCEEPTFDAAKLNRTLASLHAQSHPNWLAIVSGSNGSKGHLSASSDPRVLIAPQDVAHWPTRSSWCMRLASGDRLHAQSLEWLLQLAIQAQADCVYPDHDYQNLSGQRHTPHFKPAWDPDFHLATGYAADGCLMRMSLCEVVSPSKWHPDETLCQLILSRRQLKVERLPAVLLHLGTVRRTPPALRAKWINQTVGELNTEKITVTELPSDRGVRIDWPAPQTWPLVSVVIPTKDQLPLLRKCVESILRITDYPSLELVVVDNGSSEPATLKFLDELRRHPSCKVVHDPRAFNYSRLNNLAVNEAASGAVLALLNNDVEALEPNWLKTMVRLALREDTGCVGARLLYGNRTVQHGGVLLGISKNWRAQLGIAAHAFKGMRPDEPGYMGRAQVEQQFSAVTAACLVVRRSIFEQVGGLNEAQLAVAYNDVDFCLRVKEAGFNNVWTPHATLLHHESISRGRDIGQEKLTRLQAEYVYMQQRWGHLLGNDPAYNPNLTLTHASFELSTPSRSPYSRQ